MNRFRTVLIIFLSLTVVAAIAFVVWARSVHGPEPIAYESAMANPSIVIERRNGFITIRPRSTHPTVGLLFYPGARVAPEAYISKLAAISIAANIQIAIGRPRLNLAVFSIGQADEMRGTLSGVTRWYVGGHSLGGAMACLYASRHAARLEGVVLLGTYCGSDISKTKLRVLSVTGGSDGVFPPSKISRARGELPSGARAVQVPGMNHAEFGNYGPQPGDNAASISDAVARDKLSEEAKSFYSEPNGVD
jgi:Alpha/beta hydrolase family